MARPPHPRLVICYAGPRAGVAAETSFLPPGSSDHEELVLPHLYDCESKVGPDLPPVIVPAWVLEYHLSQM